jgi:hypothetical protein
LIPQKYACQKGESLSDIVGNYLKSISARNETVPVLSPKVAKLMGSVKLPDDFMDTNAVIDFRGIASHFQLMLPDFLILHQAIR